MSIMARMKLPMGAAILAAWMASVAGCSTSEAAHSDRLTERSESEATGWGGVRSGAADPELVADGRRIAERECASCHAVDQGSPSPPQGAPPLRDLLALNDPDRLAYRLIDVVRMGHDDMPVFDFDVRSADALIAYLGSISGAEQR